jgi:hypothetical protein
MDCEKQCALDTPLKVAGAELFGIGNPIVRRRTVKLVGPDVGFAFSIELQNTRVKKRVCTGAGIT